MFHGLSRPHLNVRRLIRANLPHQQDVVDTVAVHSVVNFMNARTSRNVFLSQVRVSRSRLASWAHIYIIILDNSSPAVPS